MKKFIKSFLITLGVVVFVLGAGFGITYAIDKDFALDLLDKIGIQIEQPVEQPDDETPGGDIEVPGEDIEIPGEDTGETEEPENPDDSEEPDDTETYICNVSDYEFDGNTITAYNGDDKYIQIPSSYSISGTEIVDMTFFDELEFTDYLMLNFEDITYPITITDANSEQYTLNSEMDVFENQDIVYPVSLVVENPIFVEGNDYQVTSIGDSAFYACTSLESIIIPERVITIGGLAFQNCSGLTSITIPDSVTSIGGGAFFSCSNLKSITIPDNVTSIDNAVFRNCTNLTNITISESVTSIGDSAFYACTSLESIIIPDSVTSIKGSAFSNCSSLTSITIPEGVTSIYSHTFEKCSSLESITLPSSITSIGYIAFSGCTSLESITINATTPPTLGLSAIPSNVTSIYVPAESVEAYKAAWSDYADKIYSIEELEVA